MPEQVDAELIEKYRKVRELARRGATPGERETAQRILARMEEKHPTLRSAVEDADAAAEREARAKSGGAWGGAGWPFGRGPFTGAPPGAGPDPWADLIREGVDFLRRAAEEQERDAAAAEDVERYARVASRIKPDGRIVVSIILDAEDVERLLDRKPSAIEAFTVAAGEAAGQELAAVLADAAQESQPRRRARR